MAGSGSGRSSTERGARIEGHIEGRHTERRLVAQLSSRDRAILQSLADHRFLTTNHLQRLHFHEHATDGAASRVCRRVLSRLSGLQLIESLERRVGGVRAGSGSYVWRLGSAGDRLLRLGAPEKARARRKQPSLHHLAHSLAVVDAHLAIVDLARGGRIELLHTEAEPHCWRSYLGLGGAKEVLKPDLYVVTAAGEFEDHWFLEIDRGTESLPTLLRKCAQYEAYRRMGGGTEDGVFPAVAWVLPDQRRADQLSEAIARSSRLDSGLYRTCVPAALPGLIAEGAA